MFEISENDCVSLEDFAYGWRWTDTDRIKITADHLARIKPLTPDKAEEAWTYSNAFQGEAYRTRFHEMDEYHIDGSGDLVRADAVQWLRARLPSDDVQIFISWTEQQAVATVLDTFIRYWDAFCFPVEDVVIWPSHERWVLLFDYKQRFYYAEEKTD